jgi:hypothetical protein
LFAVAIELIGQHIRDILTREASPSATFLVTGISFSAKKNFTARFFRDFRTKFHPNTRDLKTLDIYGRLGFKGEPSW